MARSTRSPYERVLGRRMQELHPKLRLYFSTVPTGKVGVGVGVFDVFGTRFRWLVPVLTTMEKRGVIAPGWHRNVPFRVENRTMNGNAIARRTVELDSGRWTMSDAVRLAPDGRVVDRLGHPETVAASFDIDVVDGGLTMSSRAVGMKLGPLRLRVPRILAPRIRLTERYDDSSDRQRISLTIDAPLLGRVYEYSGSFTYRIEDAG